MIHVLLTFGSYYLMWVYLIFVSFIQILIINQMSKEELEKVINLVFLELKRENEKTMYICFIIVMIGLIFLSMYLIDKYLDYKKDIKRNNGIYKFEKIKQDKKLSVDFLLVNIIPFVDLEIFEYIGIQKFISKLILILIMFIITTYSQNFSFNILLFFKGYRIYREESKEKILLMKKSEYGNKKEYQEKLVFEEIDNTEIYILKEVMVNNE